MKLWIKLLITGIASLGGGFAAGWFARKKLCEVQIEEISEEELEKLVGEEADKGNQDEVQVTELPLAEKEKTQDSLNTQKEAYFRRWKAEDAIEQYDTRTEDVPEDVMALKDEDLRIDDEDETGELPPLHGSRPDFLPMTVEEWNKALSRPDGEYDAIELTWYSQDDVVCDENDEPLENTKEFVQLDLEEIFAKVDENTTGDPDVRIFLNRKHRAMYHITRVNASWRRKKKQEEFGEDGYDEGEDLYDRFHW